MSKTGRRKSVRKKNNSFENGFIKYEKVFKLQSYLHAISRAMWAEQAASTETQHLSKALHDILQVLVQVPEPFHQMQLCLYGGQAGRKLHRSISKAKVVWFVFFLDTIFYLKPYDCANEAVERHILTCSGEYLLVLTPQGMYCCLALVVLPYI